MFGIAVALALLTSLPAPPEIEVSRPSALDGHWKINGIVFSGRARAAARPMVDSHDSWIEANRWHVEDNTGPVAWKLSINEGTREIDIDRGNGPALRGFYRLEGGRLELVCSENGRASPRSKDCITFLLVRLRHNLAE